MQLRSERWTQAIVFLLVASAFTVVYITQPVLPVLEREFLVNARTASLSVSIVIFGIGLANLPFGMIADRYPIRPIVVAGGAIIAITSLICAVTPPLRNSDRRAFCPGTLHTGAADEHCRLSLGDVTGAASERRHGLLRCSNGCGWIRRTVAGWLDPSAAPLVLCFRQRCGAGNHGNRSRIYLASP